MIRVKVTGSRPATLLKMNPFLEFFQGFCVQVQNSNIVEEFFAEHLILQKHLPVAVSFTWL